MHVAHEEAKARKRKENGTGSEQEENKQIKKKKTQEANVGRRSVPTIAKGGGRPNAPAGPCAHDSPGDAFHKRE